MFLHFFPFLTLTPCSCAQSCYLFRTTVKSSPLCSCGFDDENKAHFFLKCPNCSALRPNLFTAAANIGYSANKQLSFFSVWLFCLDKQGKC